MGMDVESVKEVWVRNSCFKPASFPPQTLKKTLAQATLFISCSGIQVWGKKRNCSGLGGGGRLQKAQSLGFPA